MLTGLTIKNFKCFQNTGCIRIAPLTFFVGPNSSGKSSILKMLLMLKQTVDSTDIDNPLVSNGGWVEMGAYPEFIYKGEVGRELEVDLQIDVKTQKRHKNYVNTARGRRVYLYPPGRIPQSLILR